MITETPASSLQKIHQLYKELAEAKEQLRTLPIKLNGREKQFNALQESLESSQGKLKELKIHADDHELTLKSKEGRISDLKAKMNQAKTNKEFDAFKSEIAHIDEQNEELQNVILDLMGKQDEKSDEINELKDQISTEEKSLEEYRDKNKYQMEKYTSRVEMLETAIQQAMADLNNEIKKDLNRLLASDKDPLKMIGEAIAGACQNCFTEQPPQSSNMLRSGQVVKCITCNAFLFQA